MKTITKVLGTAILSLGILIGCEPGDGKIKQDFDRSGQELRITVVYHENATELNRSYYERFGNDGIKRLGYAVYANPGRQPYWCEIHALAPRSTDDEKMDTLGHELSHCVFGQFHDKARRGG